ncbi:MAG: hypothetical protein DWQ07_19450 [Chloroflexi bacterium]|nr:MAG: hypothetical protein DWQ07_19450 [Chloroflexota bacterium]MBL1194258.1 hypothetical protein [Chloroflexota bacterium]
MAKQADIEAEAFRRRRLQKHATMQDDIYRKRSEELYRRRIKLPTWLLILIYGLVILFIYGFVKNNIAISSIW